MVLQARSVKVEEIREQDSRFIEQLQEQLRRLISGAEGAESEEEEAA